MDVYLCEKPSQANVVAKVLGVTNKKRGYYEGKGKIVTWCIGHLFELLQPEDYDKKWKKWDANLLPIVPQEVKYKCAKGKNDQFKAIKACLKRASRVVIATDGDREGEAIARICLEHAGYKGELARAWMTSTDEETVQEALSNLRNAEQYFLLGQSAKGRAATDWLLGMNISRALASKLKNKTTFKVAYGRVQTPALNILIQRELAIKNFTPETHYDVVGKFGNHEGTFEAKWMKIEEVLASNGLLMDSDVANYIADFISNNECVVTTADYTPKKEYCPLPFRLSDLVREASKYDLTPEECTAAMQELYDPPLSLVTYPRTDSKYLPTSMLSWCPAILENARHFGYENEVDYIDPSKVGKCWNTEKVTAHHAIVPTRKQPKDGELTGNLLTVYDIVMRRFLMQFAPERELDSSIIEVQCGGMFSFRVSTSIERFSGWKALSKGLADESNEEELLSLPRLEVGQTLVCSEAKVINKLTKKPSRFSLGSFLSELEVASKYCVNPELAQRLKDEKGIGTEATRPGLITAMQKKKLFTATKKGIITVPANVIQFYTTHVPSDLLAVDNTAILEMALDAVEKGEISLNDFLAAQKQFVAELVASLLR